MAQKKIAVQRRPHPVFLEDDLVSAALLMSRKYTRMGKPICGKRDGSASWYIRQALLEKLTRDKFRVDLQALTDYRIYDLPKR